ncbi:MAG TPA: hypothetical protein VNU21_09265 [Usitatibacter sp.]|jgi:hypothetical protein|nr:hypothetical protein [Usitatibacter sp.]
MTHDVLEDGLAALRRDIAEVHAPAALEGALVARFRQQHRRFPRPDFWWLPPLALAATLAIASWMVRMPHGAQQPAVGSATAAAEPDPGPFLALRPIERIALEPGMTVVETEFPRALLADWGLPVAPDHAGEPVRAEMLYSADGEPVAVRLIN